MVFAQGGVNFAELKAMDLEAFMEAEQARLLWQDEWNKKISRRGGTICG